MSNYTIAGSISEQNSADKSKIRFNFVKSTVLRNEGFYAIDLRKEGVRALILI